MESQKREMQMKVDHLQGLVDRLARDHEEDQKLIREQTQATCMYTPSSLLLHYGTTERHTHIPACYGAAVAAARASVDSLSAAASRPPPRSDAREDSPALQALQTQLSDSQRREAELQARMAEVTARLAAQDATHSTAVERVARTLESRSDELQEVKRKLNELLQAQQPGQQHQGNSAGAPRHQKQGVTAVQSFGAEASAGSAGAGAPGQRQARHTGWDSDIGSDGDEDASGGAGSGAGAGSSGKPPRRSAQLEAKAADLEAKLQEEQDRRGVLERQVNRARGVVQGCQ